jgi:hypothetical protein
LVRVVTALFLKKIARNSQSKAGVVARSRWFLFNLNESAAERCARAGHGEFKIVAVIAASTQQA